MPTERLGMIVKGGAGGQPANPFDRDDEGIFISKINPAGAAARDGRLHAGMRLIEVNDVSLLGVPHAEAVQTLRNAGNQIILLVCDGYDPSKAEVGAGATASILGSTSRAAGDYNSAGSVTSPESPLTNSCEDDSVFIASSSSPNKAANVNDSPQLSGGVATTNKTTTVIMKKHQTSSPSMVCVEQSGGWLLVDYF